MRLRDADTIDLLGVEKGGNVVLLTLVDDYDAARGSDEERLALLRAKLDRYLAAVDTGDVFRRVEDTTGRAFGRATPVRIRILARSPWTDAGTRFLTAAAREAAESGVTIEERVLGR